MPCLAAGLYGGGKDSAVKLCARGTALALRKLRHTPAVSGKSRRGARFPFALCFSRDLHMLGEAPLCQNAQLLELQKSEAFSPSPGRNASQKAGSASTST